MIVIEDPGNRGVAIKGHYRGTCYPEPSLHEIEI